jgi:hypothetical protein
MKTYKVRITAYVETSIVVEADNDDQACELAQQEWSDNFIVQNTYSKDLSNFTEIIGYEPEEVI